MGQGDCDTDDDCIGKLKCFNRKVTKDVPGLIILKDMPINADLCYDSDFKNFDDCKV